MALPGRRGRAPNPVPSRSAAARPGTCYGYVDPRGKSGPRVSSRPPGIAAAAASGKLSAAAAAVVRDRERGAAAGHPSGRPGRRRAGPDGGRGATRFTSTNRHGSDRAETRLAPFRAAFAPLDSAPLPRPLPAPSSRRPRPTPGAAPPRRLRPRPASGTPGGRPTCAGSAGPGRGLRERGGEARRGGRPLPGRRPGAGARLTAALSLS